MPTRDVKHWLCLVFTVSILASCKPYKSPIASSLSSRDTKKCEAEVFRQINGEKVAIDSETLELKVEHHVYRSALKGPSPLNKPNSFRSVTLVEDGFPRGPSLRYELPRCDQACQSKDSSIYMQKVHHHLLYLQPVEPGLRFDVDRYIGFAFKITGERPQSANILMQAWQGSPFTPPFSVELVPGEGEGFSLQLSVRNAKTGSNPSAKPKPVGKIENLTMDRWYTAVLYLRPSLVPNQSRDTLSVWLKSEQVDSQYKPVVSYRGVWGYPVDDTCHYGGKCNLSRKPNELLDFKIGLYRRAEPTQIVLQIDSFKFASTFESAKPDSTCPSDIQSRTPGERAGYSSMMSPSHWTTTGSIALPSTGDRWNLNPGFHVESKTDFDSFRLSMQIGFRDKARAIANLEDLGSLRITLAGQYEMILRNTGAVIKDPVLRPNKNNLIDIPNFSNPVSPNKLLCGAIYSDKSVKRPLMGAPLRDTGLMNACGNTNLRWHKLELKFAPARFDQGRKTHLATIAGTLDGKRLLYTEEDKFGIPAFLSIVNKEQEQGPILIKNSAPGVVLRNIEIDRSWEPPEGWRVRRVN